MGVTVAVLAVFHPCCSTHLFKWCAPTAWNGHRKEN